MGYEVVNTAKAAEILGCGRARVIQMIHDRTITTAYMDLPDGYVGRPGYKISVDELYSILKKREAEKNKKGNKDQMDKRDMEPIKNALGELQTCLGTLIETIEKLKEEL